MELVDATENCVMKYSKNDENYDETDIFWIGYGCIDRQLQSNILGMHFCENATFPFFPKFIQKTSDIGINIHT